MKKIKNKNINFYKYTIKTYNFNPTIIYISKLVFKMKGLNIS